MKNLSKLFAVGALLFGFAMQSYAQSRQEAVITTNLLAAVKRDFPQFVIQETTTMPVKYYGDVSERSQKDIHTGYHALLRGEKRTLSVNYDSRFNLLNAIVHRKDVAPNKEIAKSLEAAYPGWVVTENSVRTIYREKGNIQERFKFLLKYGDKTITVRTDIHGNLLNPIGNKKI